MNETFRKIIWVLLALYIIGLTCSIALMEMASALLSVMIIFGHFKWGSLFKKLGPDYFLIGFWFVALLGAIFLPDFTPAVRKEIAISPRSVLTVYVLSATLLLFRPRWELILKILFTCATVIAIYGIVQFFTGADILHSKPYTQYADSAQQYFRIKAFFTNTMTYSYLFGMIFCLFFGYIIMKPQTSSRWLWYLALAIVGSSLLMTFTRGLWIALLIAIVVMTAVISRRFFMQTVVVLTLAIAVLISASPQVRQRVDKLIHLDNSNSIRLQIWKVNWEMFKDHPLLGVGYEQNSSFVQAYNVKLFGKEGFVGHAHNHFLQILAGTGIFGLICFLGFCIYFYLAAFWLWGMAASEDWLLKAIAVGSIGAQTVMHIGGLSEAIFVDRESNHMYTFVAALTLSALLLVRSQKSQST